MSLLPRASSTPNSQFSEVDEYTVSLSNRLALRTYSDTKPKNGKIADLQKGLILVYEGKEAVGEGTGFGVPILMYEGETWFSRSSRVYTREKDGTVAIRKQFFMDSILRNKFRNVTLENQKGRSVLRYMSKVYQQHKRLRLLTLKTPFLKIGYGTVFVRRTPVGTVTLTHSFCKDVVHVKADFNLLKKEQLRKILIFNEQSAQLFRRYTDSSGIKLVDDAIGAWEAITAHWVSLTNPEGRVGFRLNVVEGSVLRRGREFLEGSLDWAGLDYELNPSVASFEYQIGLLGA